MFPSAYDRTMEVWIKDGRQSDVKAAVAKDNIHSEADAQICEIRDIVIMTCVQILLHAGLEIDKHPE